ncbi:hypothetical protein BTUL_0037g00090 [Botrytis tulipae]|uniref:FAD-binding PCMH-type domain-containing protein n=1 Tax=Botrytis tulipae TaxID=87230 RepID=A0A4Z1EX19_9HELO|nr:hypothetical protein BTUL_0037g00090 [Botrytis tulipae]
MRFHDTLFVGIAPFFSRCAAITPPALNLVNSTDLGLESLDPATYAQILELGGQFGGVDKCQLACKVLSVLSPTKLTTPSSPSYIPLPYWSVQQAEVVPSCRFDVTIPQDISTTIKISQLTDCPFAVKSGGHASFAGASSIKNGILVNLQNLNTVQLSADRGTVSIGPGNTWYDVYRVLDPLGISVVGGREAGVGVGGLTLGGGISYFSGKYGWACDNILNYEVVLADGSIVNASPTSHPDLYQALRGGSGTNFGIVTRFDAFAFEQGLLWGGSRFYSLASNASLSDVFSQFIVDAPTDEDAHLYIGYGYVPSLGGFVTLSGPVWKTVTFKNNATFFKKIHEIFVEEANRVVDAPGIMPFMALQPLSLNIIKQMQKRSGNTLGLKTEEGPFSIMNLNWGWENEEDDEKVFTALNRFVERIVDLAKEWGLDNQFIYMNYASKEQDVFGGYGEVNEKKLRDIQRSAAGPLWRNGTSRNFIRGGERKRDSVTPIAITILPGTVTSPITSSTVQPESTPSIEGTTTSSTSVTALSSQSIRTSATSVVQSTEGSKTTESKSATITSSTSSNEDNESKTSLSSTTSPSQLVSSIISSTGGTAPARSSQVSNTETRDGSRIPTATELTLTITPPLNTAPTGKSSTKSLTSSQATSESQASSFSSSQVSLQTTTFAPLPTTLPESSITAKASSTLLDSSTLLSLNSVQTTTFPLLPTTSSKATVTPESSSGETSEGSSSATLTLAPTLVSSISVAPFGTGNSSTAATGIPQSSSNSDPSSASTVSVTTEASGVSSQTSIRETLSPITVLSSTAGASSLVESVLSTKETSKVTAQPQSTIAQTRTTVTQAPVSTTGASEQSIISQTSITGDSSQATSSDSLQTTFVYVTTVVLSSTLGVIPTSSSSSTTSTSSIQVKTTKSSTSSFSSAATTIKPSEISAITSSSEPQTTIFPELPTTQPASTAAIFTTTVTPSTKTKESSSSTTKIPTSTSSITETTIQESVIAPTTQRTTADVPKTTEIASTIIISVNTADSNNGAITALTIIPVTAGSGSKSNSGSSNDAPRTTTSDENAETTTSRIIINASPTATTTAGGNGLAQTTPSPLPSSQTPVRTSTSAIDDGLKTTTLSISPPRETSITIATAPALTSAPVATSTSTVGNVCLGVGGDGKITSMSSCVGGATETETETVSVTVTARETVTVRG